MRVNLSKVTDSRQRIQTQVWGADVAMGVYENSLQIASVCLSSARRKVTRWDWKWGKSFGSFGDIKEWHVHLEESESQWPKTYSMNGFHVALNALLSFVVRSYCDHTWWWWVLSPQLCSASGAQAHTRLNVAFNQGCHSAQWVGWNQRRKDELCVCIFMEVVKMIDHERKQSKGGRKDINWGGRAKKWKDQYIWGLGGIKTILGLEY